MDKFGKTLLLLIGIYGFVLFMNGATRLLAAKARPIAPGIVDTVIGLQ